MLVRGGGNQHPVNQKRVIPGQRQVTLRQARAKCALLHTHRHQPLWRAKAGRDFLHEVDGLARFDPHGR